MQTNTISSSSKQSSLFLPPSGEIEGAFKIMSNYQQPAPEGKDPELWEIAQKRASFKNHLIVYLIVNAFLWGIWFFTGNQHRGINVGEWHTRHYPWPIWTTLGWGIGLAFHFAGAYIFPKANSVEREYEKLKNQQKTK